MIGRATALIWILAAAAALAPAARGQESGVPAATPLWTISSEDCVSVHADGDPWDECGFQAFAMNRDATRVLTVSARGAIQLWSGEGRELKRVDWADHPSGATGYPTGEAALIGDLGVAVTHQNQLLVMNVADGRVLAQRVADLMSFESLRVGTDGRLLAEAYERNWSTAVYEIILPSGELRKVAGMTSLLSESPTYWIKGLQAPFVVQAAGAQWDKEKADWACVPVGEHFCFRSDFPGRFIHVVDARQGGGRSIDLGRTLGQYDFVDFAVAGDRPYAVICGKSPDSYPPRRPCKILDMVSGRRIYSFHSTNRRVDGGLDEQGGPEIRLSIFNEPGERKQWRVSAAGRMRVVDAAGRATLVAPGGGMILPGETEGTSLLVHADGRPVARLPFPAQTCGNGWPDWSGWCRVSADRRRWLVPSGAGNDEEKGRGGLTLYAVPGRR